MSMYEFPKSLPYIRKLNMINKSAKQLIYPFCSFSNGPNFSWQFKMVDVHFLKG